MRTAIVYACLPGLLTACGAPMQAPAALPAGKWVVVEASFSIPAGITPTLEFAAGRLSAHSGCNRASGPYKDVGGKLETGPLMSTRMSCGPERDRLEGDYYSLLSAGPAYRLDREFLILSSGSNHVRMKRVD